jgi:hypothetical protein
MSAESRGAWDAIRKWLTAQGVLAVVGALGGILAALVAAIISGSSSEVATEGPAMVPTSATLTASVAVASPSSAPSLRTVLDERFTDRQDNWPNDPGSTAWFANGVYHLFAREPSRFVAIGAPIGTSLRDVIVTGLFRKIGGPPGGGYGLIVRDQGPGPRNGINQLGQYYVLEAGDRGEVGVWRREHDHWVDLLSWMPSEAVRPGDLANQLTAQAAGEQLTFLVNGVQVAEVTDPILIQGAVGVFVGGDFNEVVLDRLIVQVTP